MSEAEKTNVSKWPATKLRCLVQEYPGAWGSETPDGRMVPILVLGVGNVSNDGQLLLDGAQTRYFPPTEDCVAQTGDLLVVKSSGSASNIRSGKTGLCSSSLSGTIACSNFMMLLRPTAQEADSRFLWYFLNSHYAKAYVQLIATSSTYPNIKWGTYGDMPVPIPPLGEQQRIVDILDKAMAQIQRAMDAIATERRETTALRAAVLRQALDPATHPSWPMVKLGNDAFFEIQAGGTPDSGEPKFWNGTINWVTLEDLPQGQAISEIKTTHRRITEEGLKRSAATLLPVGTVVVSSRATIGRVGIALVPLATNQGFKNVVVKNPSEALSRFVAYAILNLTDQMQELASGGTFKEISRRHVADLVIPLPPIEAQQRIADILDKAVEQVDRINGTLDEQERQLTALRSSILDAAFRGEL